MGRGARTGGCVVRGVRSARRSQVHWAVRSSRAAHLRCIDALRALKQHVDSVSIFEFGSAILRKTVRVLNLEYGFCLILIDVETLVFELGMDIRHFNI